MADIVNSRIEMPDERGGYETYYSTSQFIHKNKT